MRLETSLIVCKIIISVQYGYDFSISGNDTIEACQTIIEKFMFFVFNIMVYVRQKDFYLVSAFYLVHV